MSKKDEALKLALEALEEAWYHVGTFQPTEKAIDLYDEARTAIKEALSSCQCPECRLVLHTSDCAVHNKPAYPKGACNCGAQPEQEPVAWVCEASSSDEKHAIDYWPGDVDDLPIGTKLYTSPPQRTWVGLTDDEIRALASWWPSYDQMPALMVLAKDIQNSLKERNHG